MEFHEVHEIQSESLRMFENMLTFLSSMIEFSSSESNSSTLDSCAPSSNVSSELSTSTCLEHDKSR